MKCSKCGYEADGVFSNCPECGEPAVFGELARVKNFISEKLYLAFTVAMVLTTVQQIVFVRVIPVIELAYSLVLIAMYVNAKRNSDESLVRYFKEFNGVIKVHYILLYIGAVIYFIVGGLLIATQEASKMITDVLEDRTALSGPLLEILGKVSAPLFFFFGALTLIFLGFAAFRLHRFTHSVLENLQGSASEVLYAESAKKWIIALMIYFAASGILNGSYTELIVDCITIALYFGLLKCIEKYYL